MAHQAYTWLRCIRALGSVRAQRRLAHNLHHDDTLMALDCRISGHGRRPTIGIRGPSILNSAEKVRSVVARASSPAHGRTTEGMRRGFLAMFAPFCEFYSGRGSFMF